MIEDVRWRRKQFTQPWSELPPEVFEGSVRLSTYELPPTAALDATGAAARRRFRLPTNIVGDDGSETAYRPFQRMVTILRQDWDQAILIASAALPDVKDPPPPTRPRAHPSTAQQLAKVAIPIDVIEHTLGRRELAPGYDLAL